MGSHSEKKFQPFLEAAPDAIVVVNGEGQIIMLNGLTETMFGYPRESMLGQRVEMLVPERFRDLHVQHRSSYFLEPRTRPMGEGRELSGRRRDGSEFSIEISLSPLETEEDKLVISIIRDITQRKQLEAKFRGLLESAPDGIVVVNTAGKIVIVNGQAEALFGYGRSELLGQPIEILIPDRFKNLHRRYRDEYIQCPRIRPMGAGQRLAGLKKDGTEIPVEVSLSPLETEQGTLITSIVRDITDRRKVEEKVQASLKEKEALLKEIHHRVKNNLQVTSSLLKLQSDYIEDKRARDMFYESQNRIRSMALVHEKLYKASDLSRIDFSEYAESLTKLLFQSFGVDSERIQFSISGGPVFLSIESAIPCGLLLNELVSNCLKHAFPSDRKGRIHIQIGRQENGQISIAVEDTGIGLPQGFSIGKVETLGLQLVGTLVKQIDGRMSVKNENGASFQIVFMENKGRVQ